MASARSDQILREIRTLFDSGTLAGLSDAQLLERFASCQAEASAVTRGAEVAFAALVARHGPMVLGVCRRMLSSPEDIEDAFQATFLVLVRRASSVRVGDSLGRWLHGVARRVAAKARVRSEQRRARLPAIDSEPVVPGYDPVHAELLAALDEELSRLPDKYQAPLILCQLEGLTHAEAAHRLRWPIGTVSGRLFEARSLLKQRLNRRGFSLAIAPLATVLDTESHRATVPEPLVRSLRRTASRIGTGTAGSTTAVVLAESVVKDFVMSKLRIGLAASTLLGMAVVGAGAWARSGSQEPGTRQTPATKPATERKAKTPKPGNGDARATQLALGVHAQAAAIDKLPRFSYQARSRHGIVDSMRAVDVTLDRLKAALNDPVLDKDWVGWYETGFSRDEERFLSELRPGQANLNYAHRFWTRTDAWDRHEATNHSSVDFVRMAGPAILWKHSIQFESSYLRLTPHRFWWGRTVHSQAMSTFPTERATWRHLSVEQFAGETCDIVDSSQRTERLWIGRGSGRVRGVLSYDPVSDDDVYRSFYQRDTIRRIAGRKFARQWDYANWISGEATPDQLIEVGSAWIEANPITSPAKMELNEFVRFDDYREIRPGIWLPFRETRASPRPSDTGQGKHKIIRSELRVEEVRTELSLANRFAELLPREGNQVQDQRFIVEVNLKYRANQTDEEIRNLAVAEYDRRLKQAQFVTQWIKPVADMVGEPAPTLPRTGWIGGQPPDLTGKPYLLHFWATWCDSSKNDFPRLKALRKRGVIVLGMHPSQTPFEEVEKVIRDHQLDYPTFLAQPPEGNLIIPRIGGYPMGVFPYCILVDAQGRVAGHGSLSDVLRKFGVGSLQVPRP